MPIKFVLMVNKQGQTRLASYFSWYALNERAVLEAEIIRRCLSRTEYQCSFLEYRGLKIIYRRYASLFFVVAVDGDEEVRKQVSRIYYVVFSLPFLSLFTGMLQNELAILEFIHSLVETMDKYFESVCELDIMFHIEKAHYIVNEMVSNGVIVDNNKVNILRPLQLMDQIADK